MANTLKELCKKIYQALPVVRELSRLEARVDRILPGHLRFTEAGAVVQAWELTKAGHPHYRDPKRLLSCGAQYWSQNMEDGMIAEIFRRIGVAGKTFLEIGVGDGSENNTTALLSAGWRGWWLEGNGAACRAVERRLREMPSLAERLKVKHAYVQPDNIGSLLAELGVPAEVDLFSLDIDLNTYHIWSALKTFRPRVVVVEYNAGIAPGVAWIHPFEREGIWDGSQAQGASLKAYEELGRALGYCLVGCDLTGLNAFFVRADLVGDRFAAPFTSENHYEPPRYYLTYRFGHPSKFYGESHRPE